MDVAIIDGDVPFPSNSGKRLRSLNLVLPLARRHRITYVARCASASEGRTAAEFLADHGITPVMVEAPVQAKRGAAFYGRLAANLASSLPYQVTTHTFPAMRQAVQRIAAGSGPSLWQVEWSGYLYAVVGSDKPVVLQAHNVDQLIWQRYLETETNPLKKLYIRGQLAKMQRFEAQSFAMATRVVAVSEQDAALARKLYRPRAVDVVDNGVDIGFFSEVRRDPAARKVLFLGALDWRPNQEGIALLLDRIFPALRARIADAELMIVGRNPSEALARRVGETAGVSLHANVPDVRPYMASSAVMAVPLTVGGGSRLKILEALAAGLPVVSTSVGAEGLRLLPGEHYLRADTAEEMTTALAACLQGQGLSPQACAAAKTVVAADYDWPRLADKLERTWERAVGGGQVDGVQLASSQL